MKRNRTRGNGEGSIIKLSGKRKKPYAVRVTAGFKSDGRQIFKYVGYYKTKTEAKLSLNNFLINPYDLDSSKLTTQDIFEKWSESAKISDEVIKAYYGVLNNNGLTNKIFKDIKLMELEDIARQLTPSMQKRFRNALKNLYIYAMKHDIVNKNLAELMELDKYKAKEKEAINPTDIKKILKGDDDIAKLLLFTGMRITELLSIETENVDLESRIMIGGLKTEAGINRKIPIHKNIYTIVEKLFNKGHKYLITDEKGKQITYDNYLKKWHEDKTKTKYTPHYTRHTMVSRAIKLGLDRSILQKIIGHSNKDVTDIYTHLDIEQLISFIDSFNYN